jgi:hypothetical protein
MLPDEDSNLKLLIVLRASPPHSGKEAFSNKIGIILLLSDI